MRGGIIMTCGPILLHTKSGLMYLSRTTPHYSAKSCNTSTRHNPLVYEANCRKPMEAAHWPSAPKDLGTKSAAYAA